jgi:hypothetical protein
MAKLELPPIDPRAERELEEMRQRDVALARSMTFEEWKAHCDHTRKLIGWRREDLCKSSQKVDAEFMEARYAEYWELTKDK